MFEPAVWKLLSVNGYNYDDVSGLCDVTNSSLVVDFVCIADSPLILASDCFGDCTLLSQSD